MTDVCYKVIDNVFNNEKAHIYKDLTLYCVARNSRFISAEGPSVYKPGEIVVAYNTNNNLFYKTELEQPKDTPFWDSECMGPDDVRSFFKYYSTDIASLEYCANEAYYIGNFIIGSIIILTGALVIDSFLKEGFVPCLPFGY